MLDLFFAIVRRFIKGFIASFASVLGVVAYADYTTLTSLDTAIQALFISAVIAGVSGGLLAVEKGLRWQ
jgi:hypothetical protein